MNELEKRLEKYLKLTEKAIQIASKSVVNKKRCEAEDLLKLSRCYFEDAKHFKKKGELLNALSAVNYAHAFLDAGVILKVFKVKDSALFMTE